MEIFIPSNCYQSRPWNVATYAIVDLWSTSSVFHRVVEKQKAFKMFE